MISQRVLDLNRVILDAFREDAKAKGAILPGEAVGACINFIGNLVANAHGFDEGQKCVDSIYSVLLKYCDLRVAKIQEV